MDRSLEHSSNLGIWIPASIAVAIVISIWFFLPPILTGSYCNITEKGAYGDMYGTVNALFTALAFVGFLTTIFLQRKELILQRVELSLTRKVLEGQEKQIKVQSSTFHQQRFENTFFELIRIHIEIVSALSKSGRKTEIRGRECLGSQVNTLRQIWTEFGGKVTNLIDEAMDKLYNDNPPHLGHYFRQLYHIVLFVHSSEVQKKQRYADFIQAQLNNDELVLLAYNGLSKHGGKFKPLIEEFGLLENLTWGTLFSENHARGYSEKAFGKRGYKHQYKIYT